MAAASSASLALLVAVLVIVPQPGWSIKCFECNSHQEPQCAQEVPPDSFKKDCPARSPEPFVLCRKIVQSIEYEVNGLKPDSRVIRSCGWDNSSFVDRCYQRSGFGGRQEVCTCTTDLCNGAERSAALPFLAAAPFLLRRLL